MEDLKIRRAEPEDQKWVAKLFDANKEILGKVGGGTVFWRWLNGKNAREHWWVVPGVAFAHWLVKKDGTKCLYEIAVDKEHKRKGIGKKLLSIIGLPMELKTDAENAESNQFYKGLGFTKVGNKVAKDGKKISVYQKW